VLARDLERRQAVAGLQHPVAMRLEKIVEELHIELVVLDNEHRFERGCPCASVEVRWSRHRVGTAHDLQSPGFTPLAARGTILPGFGK
jgi:hypothetical protein